MHYNILIVEDEPRLRQVLQDFLVSKGDHSVAAADGVTALEIAKSQSFDGVLLDIMMPRLDGLAVCRALRKTSDVPIIFLTALSDEEDKLEGYRLGGDDYITKPFSMAVLYAKLTALIQRSRGSIRQSDVLTAGPIRLRLSARKAFLEETEIPLTPKEYRLLEQLMRNRNTVLTRERLLELCWGFDYEGDARAVDTHIRRLREKLGPAAGLIRTVIKTGYCLEVPYEKG